MTLHCSPVRWTVSGMIAAAIAMGIGNPLRQAYAQETKCYLMVCTGSVCGATQIPCPPPPTEETPKVPATGNT